MKPQVVSLLVVMLAAAAWAEPIKGGFGGGGGKGKGGGYGDDDYHYDPGFEAYAPVVTYQAVKVKKPTIIHEEVIEHHPQIVKKPIHVHQAPPPILVQKPVTTYVKEWKLVTVPKTTYQQVWVHKIPIHQDSGKGKGKGGFGGLFGGGGKGKGKGGGGGGYGGGGGGGYGGGY